MTFTPQPIYCSGISGFRAVLFIAAMSPVQFVSDESKDAEYYPQNKNDHIYAGDAEDHFA